MLKILKDKTKNLIFKNTFLFLIYRIIFEPKKLYVEVKTYLTLKKIKDLNKTELGDLTHKKLLHLLNYAVINVPFYKKLFQKSGSLSLEKFPIISKETIISNYSEFFSTKYKKNNLIKRNTGGSTGQPFIFFSDQYAGNYDNAHHWYTYSLMGHSIFRNIISCGGFSLNETQLQKNIFWKKLNKLSVFGAYQFSALYISDENIKFYVEKILSVKPSILRGYPSFWDRIAKFILKNNIKIDFEVNGINLTAEMCTNEQRENIELAFSSRVYFEYGNSEMSVFMYTDDKSYVYKSSPIYGYAEVIDDHGNSLDTGQIGKIVVTGFNNLAMPLIRYDTGDLGVMSEKHHGYIELSQLKGRSQDIIYTKDGNKVLITALIFGQHINAFKNIREWQLYQDELGKVVITIVKGDEYSSLDEKDILENFLNASDFQLEFNYTEKITKTKSGKHLFVIQKIDNDGN